MYGGKWRVLEVAEGGVMRYGNEIEKSGVRRRYAKMGREEYKS